MTSYIYKDEVLSVTQTDVLKEKAQSAERVGWFAGATISVSFTIVGYLFSQSNLVALIHGKTILFLILMLGWFFLGVSIISSFLVRLLGISWIYHATSSELIRQNKTELTQDINSVYPKFKDKLKSKANRSQKMLKVLEPLVYIGGILGIVLLLAFLMGLSYFTIFY